MFDNMTQKYYFVFEQLNKKESVVEAIQTALGEFSREKFNALIDLRSTMLEAARKWLTLGGECYTEVSTASLVNIAGSCENPHASFKLNYYGREAHLSQSAQLQLEALVIRLKRGVFTVNNSFREENYDDPESRGRRLSEFTLIEAEKPYQDTTPDEALNAIMRTEESLVKYLIGQALKSRCREIEILGGNINYLESACKQRFMRITYHNVIDRLNQTGGSYKFEDDLGIKEERKILAAFGNVPTFVIGHPAKIKFFNMKRSSDSEVYSVDLLLPPLGETVGGAVREEDGQKIRQQLLESKIAKYIQEHGGNTFESFREYLNLFEQEEPLLRGGFGLGFERFIGFLVNSNDILETIAYRSMQPSVS